MALININGVSLEIERISGHGQSGRSPIVFLHEGLGSVVQWTTREGDWPQAVCEASERDGVVYSRRGYGRSDPIPDVRGANRLPPDYMHQEAQTVLPALLQTLGLQQPVLLGHSDGGTIALLHASQHPVSACVVLAPHVMVESISLEAIAAAREAYLHGPLRERLSRYHDDVDSAFWQWNDVWLSPAFRSFDIREDCRRISAPVLAIQGREDPYGTLQQIEDIRPDHGRIERLVLDHCGHVPQRDQSQACVARIASFLAACP
jgi:pimeloyl-ACP methyl ester carboxylesterase